MPDQESLFSVGGSVLTPHNVELPDGDVRFLPDFFRVPDNDRLMSDIDETTVWRRETVKMFGKVMPIPRLTAWYGDAGKTYTYSKIEMSPAPWTPPILEIKEAVEAETDAVFNSVLLNLYRDGSDGVAWHSDDEPELGAEPVIASVSLGATRRFQLRSTADSSQRRELQLTHGSLLVMAGRTQQHWEHQVPKTSRRVGPRINLTFRRIS